MNNPPGAGSSLWKWVTAALLAIGLLSMWTRQLTDAPITSDAVTWLQMAVNFERQGVLSVDKQEPFRPNNYREPVPSLVSAAAIWIADSVAGKVDAQAYFSGERLSYVKYQNVLWMILLSLSAFWAVKSMTSSFYVGLLGVALINFPFRPKAIPGPIDDLMTELPSTGLLVLASMALAKGFQRKSIPLYVLSGFLFGALALTKAVALYAFLGALVVVTCFYFLQGGKAAVAPAARALVALLVPFICVVAPWMYRNQLTMGTVEITQRAGQSMYDRSLLDQMTAPEHLGAYVLWAPMMQPTLGKLLGYSPAEERAGGRLHRLQMDDVDDLEAELAGRPDLTVTVFRQARAEREKLKIELRAAGDTYPEVRADKLLKYRALKAFTDHPWSHFSKTPLFLWRGAADSTLIFLLALLVAARLRRYDLALFVLPVLGITALYALFTPFVPRYGVPAHLMAILTVLVLAKLLWDARGNPGGLRAATMHGR